MLFGVEHFVLSLSATPLDCKQPSQTQDACFDELTLSVIFRLALWSFKECQVARVDIFLKMWTLLERVFSILFGLCVAFFRRMWYRDCDLKFQMVKLELLETARVPAVFDTVRVL